MFKSGDRNWLDNEKIGHAHQSHHILYSTGTDVPKSDFR